MKKLLSILALTVASLPAQNNLTSAQKEADFRYLASLFSTYYAPAEWKKQQFGADIYNIKSWVDRVNATQSDLDFYEVCAEYVAQLKDSHDSFSLTSDFNARLGFTVDIYDGALLIDALDRTSLPVSVYPFVIGDELVSIDGVDAKQILDNLSKFVPQGNVRASRRQTAQRVTNRAQSRFPHAVDVPDKSLVQIRRQNGTVETYTIAWVRTGTPLTAGPVVSPKAVRKPRAEAETDEPDYMKPLRELQFSGVIDRDLDAVNGYGARNPIFTAGLPSTFTRRLGSSAADFYYSGTFKFVELSIGYIRIPNYSPPNATTALRQFEQEIAFMSANTDGLIIDEMRNTGGSLCFGEDIAARLIPYPFQATGFQTKPFWGRVNSFYNSMISAKTTNASPEIIAQYELLFNELLAASQEGRLTKPVPLCTSSLNRDVIRDNTGTPIAYTKPLMVIIDEFSTSTADSVAGMVQDSGRAVFYGWRTNGAGGNNTTFDAGTYSEGVTGMTLALQTRKSLGIDPAFPASNLIENTGVQPHIQADYMTKDNLLRSGAGFVDGFLQSMAAYIRSQK